MPEVIVGQSRRCAIVGGSRAGVRGVEPRLRARPRRRRRCSRDAAHADAGRSAILLALRRPRRGLAAGRLPDPRRRRRTAAASLSSRSAQTGEVRDALATLRAALARADGAMPEGVRVPLTAIMERWRQPVAFVGNVDGEVWRLLESGIAPEQWLDGTPGTALRWLATRTETLGWSTKQEGSWEPVGIGDQLSRGCRGAAPPPRGSLRYWWIEAQERADQPGLKQGVRRLRYLKDTAGGCAPGFDAFRRLPLTWHADLGAAEQDGVDGSEPGELPCPAHIGAELSRTHYHPQEPIGGGRPQFELYFALDPAQWRLGTAGRTARLYTFPTIGAWADYEVTDLTPGTIALIPADTGHRGCDVFAHIVTVPGLQARQRALSRPRDPRWHGRRGAAQCGAGRSRKQHPATLPVRQRAAILASGACQAIYLYMYPVSWPPRARLPRSMLVRV